MSLRRSALALGLLAAAPLCSGLAAASAALAQSPAPLPIPTVEWAPCAEEFPGTECAVVQVPLDYDRPDGESIELALARYPAASGEERVGSLFVNPGGPGGSAVDLVLSGFGQELAEQLGGRFDVVGIDPRGVAHSTPLRCFDSNEEANAFVANLPLFPYRREQQQPTFEVAQALTDICLARGRRIAEHMSTADVARDMDLVRHALGDEQLSYLGVSYGSFLGATYANLFPERVRALVIDAVLDPRLWSRGWEISSDRVATQQEFEEFLRLCDEAGANCALGGPQGAEARYEALVAALLETPLQLPEGVYSYDILIADSTFAMYIPEFWGGPDGYAALFAELADAALGDRQALQRAGALRQALEQRLRAARLQREDEYDNGLEGYLGNHCADARYPRSLQEWRGVDRYARAGSRFGPFWWWGNTPCATWPEADDRHSGPWNARTAAPVLVVGNYFDGVTAYSGAQAASRLLGGSRLLSYAGWGHGAFERSECVTQHVLAYLGSGILPPEGTLCPANPSPFEALPEQRSRGARRLPRLGLPPALPSLR